MPQFTPSLQVPQIVMPTPRAQPQPAVQSTSDALTLDALMKRQQEIAQAQGQTMQMKVASPEQGMAQMAWALVNGLKARKAERDIASGNADVSRALGMMDPTTGEMTPEGLALLGARDPDLMKTFYSEAQASRRAKAQADAEVASREDTQAFQAGEGDKTRQAEITAAQERARVEAAQAETGHGYRVSEAQTGAELDAAKPQTAQAKIYADFNSGRYGDPSSPEAIAARDAALTEANAVKGNTTIEMPGESSTLKKEFYKKVGGDLFPAYISEAATAAGLSRDMELLDALGATPQGPIPGYLAKLFPGVDSAQAAFNSIVLRAAPQQRASGSGSTSDIEYQGMLKSLPALGNNPEANRLISGMVKARAAISIKRGQIISQWQSGKLDDDAAFAALAETDSQSIMTPELKKLIDAVMPSSAGTTPATTGGDPEVDTLVKKYTQPGG